LGGGSPVKAEVDVRKQTQSVKSPSFSLAGLLVVIGIIALLLAPSAAYAAESETVKPNIIADSQPGKTVTHELIGDSHFERGCVLWEPKTGSHVEYGMIAGFARSGKPVWRLAQWSSREKLPLDPPQTLPSGALRYANAAKAVTLGRPGTADADLTLAVNGSVEYGGHVRKQGEPWVHLLVEQQFENPPSLAALNQASFHVAARLKAFRRLDMPGYSPQLHAAQNQIYFTLQNRNQKSAGFGQLLWFGVPLFDDRERISKSYQARDAGKDDASGMFIYLVDGREFTTRSLHDKEWVTMDKDLLPFMREGMKAAWKSGFLKESQSMADYRITGINLGWEVPGIFDVEMQVRDLSLQVTIQPDTK
jgi:hypothetical protein